MNKRQAELLSKLDPDSFTLDEIQTIFRVSKWAAKLIMFSALRRGDFVRNGDRYALAPEVKL